MLPGPVFNVELLTTARRARNYATRFAYGMILLFFLWQNNPTHYAYLGRPGGGMTIGQLAEFGAAVFRTLVWVQGLGILFLTPALVAGVIADEKQRKTLHYLLASRLTSAEIILGKLAARLLHVGTFLIIGVPVMGLLGLVGGVDPNAVWAAFAGTLTTAIFVASLSILISTYARRPREAVAMAYVVEFAWLLLPTLLTLPIPMPGGWFTPFYEWTRPAIIWVAPSSPFYLMIDARPAANGLQWLEPLLWMMGLQLAYGAAFALLATARLRPVFRKEGERRRWLARAGRARRLWPRPACGDDAMLWKERHVSRSSGAARLVTALIGLLLVGALVYFGWDFARPAFVELGAYGYGSGNAYAARHEFSMFIRLVGALIYVAIALGIASAASGGMAQEREADTWISLVSTPLDGLEIVRAKMIGAAWGARWAVAALLALWLVGVAAGSVHPLGFVAALIELAIFLWFVAALGVMVSIRAKGSARAMTAAVSTLLVLNGGYLMCCIPAQPNSVFIMSGVTPFILSTSLFTYEEMRWMLNGPVVIAYDSEIVATCFCGFMFYAAAALVLTLTAINQFDAWIGRPRRDWTQPATRTPVEFLDEPDEKTFA